MRNLVGFLLALIVPGQSATAQTVPYPPVKLIAELPVEVDYVAPTLNGRRLYYVDYTPELWLYDVASKRSTKVAAGEMDEPSVSARGNRIVFKRTTEGGSQREQEIWTIPLDSKTGLATGPARRASVGIGTDPSVSPDGMWIAFASRVGGYHLTVIPAEGGPERILLTGIQHMGIISWSPDQQWLYFYVVFQGSPEGTLQRIAVAGGKPEVIARGQEDWPGLSPDGAVLATDPMNADLTLMDAKGKQLGQIPSPGADAWLSPSAMLLWEGHRLNPLKAIALSDGKVRELLPAGYDIRTPAWAPDGKSFAVLGWSPNNDSKLLIADPDGNNLRIIPVSNQAKETRIVWSPDSRWIAMTKLFGVAIQVVEVASGKTQLLRTTVTNRIGMNPRWTADSKHVRYHYYPPDPARPGANRSIFREVGLDGSDVLVRDKGILPRGGAPISDTTVVEWDSTGTYVRSLTSDRSVRLWAGPGGPSASGLGDLLAMTPPGWVPGDTAQRTTRTADVVTSAGAHIATLLFPSALPIGILGSFQFTPDNKNLVTWGWNLAVKGCCVLYVAPLDGGPVRTVAQFGTGPTGVPPFALSPDGKTLLYAGEGITFRTGVWSVDVSGLVGKASKD